MVQQITITAYAELLVEQLGTFRDQCPGDTSHCCCAVCPSVNSKGGVSLYSENQFVRLSTPTIKYEFRKARSPRCVILIFSAEPSVRMIFSCPYAAITEASSVKSGENGNPYASFSSPAGKACGVCTATQPLTGKRHRRTVIIKHPHRVGNRYRRHCAIDSRHAGSHHRIMYHRGAYKRGGRRRVR